MSSNEEKERADAGQAEGGPGPQDSDSDFKCGLVAVLGEPNVGKSTLVNKMVGFKVAAVTDKPQTTRDRIRAVVTRQEGQIVFVDTPGVHRAKKALNKHLVEQALRALADVDVTIVVVTPKDRPDHMTFGLRLLWEQFMRSGVQPILVINKIDRIKEHSELLPLLAGWDQAVEARALVPVSALTGEGLDRLEREIFDALPVGPALFPEEMVTDRSERWLAAEVVREVLTESLREELPYSLAVQVERFTDRPDLADTVIEAVIYVERSSQKAIVLGKQGSRIKEVGTAARKRLTDLLGRKVHLKLWVKVEPDWTKNRRGLRKMGYRDDQ